MKRSAVQKAFTTAAAVCLLAVAAFSAWQVYGILHATSTAKKAYSEITQQAAPQQQAEPSTPKDPLQRRFDWASLQASYPDIVGWISDPAGSIDYPILQAADNDYYLTHLPGGTQNNHGSLFLDHRGSADFSDLNNLVYGHNMKDGTMLASLTGYADQDYYEAHSSLVLYTPQGNYILPVQSAYETTANGSAYRMGGNAQNHAQWLQQIREHSAIMAQPCSEAEPRILTLSTCINGTDSSDRRFVVHLAILPAEA